jgi:hypothetical protein
MRRNIKNNLLLSDLAKQVFISLPALVKLATHAVLAHTLSLVQF